jgi:hypothetical protein
MRLINYFSYFALFALLVLFSACEDKDIATSVKNETNDTIYVSTLVGKRGWTPEAVWNFREVPPDSIYTYVYSESSWYKDDYFLAYIVKQDVVDSITLAMVMVKGLWSKVYSYTYSEMEKMQFVVRVRSDDFEQ